MTPDLMKQGAQRVAHHAEQLAQASASGGREAGYGRVLQDRTEVDVSHGRILYLEDVSVSFDGFKAINDSYGPHVGDTALREIATALQGALPPSAAPGQAPCLPQRR